MYRIARGISLTTVGGILGWSQAPSVPTTSYHLESPTNIEAVEVDTGDVVVFDRKCDRFGWYGACLCRAAKFNWGEPTPWDHVGVVVRQGGTPHGRPMLMEADVNGVKVRPLDARIQRSKRSNVVVVRRLETERTPEMRRAVEDFVQSVKNNPYKNDVLQMFRAAVDTETKKLHFGAVRDLLDAHEALDRAERHAARGDVDQATLESLRERVRVLDLVAIESERRWEEGGLFLNKEDLNSFFCSELVAATHQKLGVLRDQPPANEYLPHHFMSGTKRAEDLTRDVLKAETTSSSTMVAKDSSPTPGPHVPSTLRLLPYKRGVRLGEPVRVL